MPLVRYIGKPDPLQRELDRQEALARQRLREGRLLVAAGDTPAMAVQREALARTRETFRRKGISEGQVWEYNHRRLGGAGPDGSRGVVRAAIPGVTRRLLGPADGLSQSYAWGPLQFVQVMTDGDWAVIQRLAERDEFALVEQE